MKLQNSPFSLLPSQLLGIKSLIRYGLESFAFVDTFCIAALMLFNISILLFSSLIHFCAQLLYDFIHFLPQLLLKHCQICCGDHVCLLTLLKLQLLLLLPRCCDWPRGSFERSHARGAKWRSATMSNASLFRGTLEPTRMRW